MQIDRKKITPPETLSSLWVAFLEKKEGQSPVSLSQAMRPTEEQDEAVGVPAPQTMG
jgi:hypothetical protein